MQKVNQSKCSHFLIFPCNCSIVCAGGTPAAPSIGAFRYQLGERSQRRRLSLRQAARNLDSPTEAQLLHFADCMTWFWLGWGTRQGARGEGGRGGGGNPYPPVYASLISQTSSGGTAKTKMMPRERTAPKGNTHRSGRTRNYTEMSADRESIPIVA